MDNVLTIKAWPQEPRISSLFPVDSYSKIIIHTEWGTVRITNPKALRGAEIRIKMETDIQESCFGN